MAYITERPRADGTTAYLVQWREQGKAKGLTFDDPAEADLLKRFLDANGNSFALATEAAKIHRSTSPRLGPYLTAHIEQQTHLTDGTRRSYRYLAGRHITGTTLGGLPLEMITRRHIAQWMTGLTTGDKPLSAKSVKNVHALLSTALTAAVAENLIESNPAKGLRPPVGTRRQPVFLTTAQRTQILTALPGYHRGIHAPDVRLFKILEGTGLRFSEATALVREDAIIQDGRVRLRVTKAWKRVSGGYVVGPPKSKKSIRTVSLTRSLSTELIPILETLEPGELIIRNRLGTAFRNQVWVREYWNPAVKGLGMSPAPRSHDLRHSHASDLIAAGVDLLVVRDRLGHESITTTVDTYGHLLTGADERAADALDG